MKVVVSIGAPSTRAALRLISRANRLADLIELRLDLLPAESLEALIRACRKPVLATLRSKREGGEFNGRPAAVERRLHQALKRGVEFLDVEFALPAKTRKRLMRAAAAKKKKVILSRHFPARTLPLAELMALLKRMARVKGVEHLKIVTRADSVEDNGVLLSLHLAAHRQGVPLIAHAMGPLGRVSRHLGPLIGADLAFARLEGQTPAADGQPTVTELRRGKRSAVCAVVGKPIGHSLSPALHNAGFHALGMDAVFLALEAECLAEAVGLARKGNFLGLSVTLPFKADALNLADQADALAGKIGAANTLVSRGGKLVAFNTDCPAAVEALETVAPVRGKKALILGAGGMAKATAIGLRVHGCEVALAARHPEKARSFCRAHGLALRSLRSLHALTSLDVDFLVNATPLGMEGAPFPLPIPARLLRGQTVLDCVYNPVHTPLLRAAEARGCRTVSGLEVFVRQGVRQFQLFTGRKAPVKAMRAAVVRRLRA
ncbi:MAG: shikimate dehydrogenase [Candidatus Diapherotrites archaeon]|uniref:Multifunctional fusion protein n=1 Tax=Candidatus Iainarchaeum sp. TaxID=3101447 RepID=A0A8T4L7M0_9ARCH|nr:shikimate dehydrogenase [Candidatus Diapherotrites archaeon]